VDEVVAEPVGVPTYVPMEPMSPAPVCLATGATSARIHADAAHAGVQLLTAIAHTGPRDSSGGWQEYPRRCPRSIVLQHCRRADDLGCEGRGRDGRGCPWHRQPLQSRRHARGPNWRPTVHLLRRGRPLGSSSGNNSKPASLPTTRTKAAVCMKMMALLGPSLATTPAEGTATIPPMLWRLLSRKVAAVDRRSGIRAGP
jgi:hypothetical protein